MVSEHDGHIFAHDRADAFGEFCAELDGDVVCWVNTIWSKGAGVCFDVVVFDADESSAFEVGVEWDEDVVDPEVDFGWVY